jgi:hypothetical protein
MLLKTRYSCELRLQITCSLTIRIVSPQLRQALSLIQGSIKGWNACYSCIFITKTTDLTAYSALITIIPRRSLQCISNEKLIASQLFNINDQLT